MLTGYLKTTIRVFLKNKLFTGINILGLAVGITAYMLISQYVKFESNYDQHLTEVDDLYRVTLTSNLGDKGFQTFATNHPAVGSAMKEEFPEVASFTRVVDRNIVMGSFVLSYTDEKGGLIKSNINEDKLFIADSSAIDFFNLQLTKGDAESALKNPTSIILSEEVAERFFGSQDPIGKILMFNSNSPFTVTGVFKELPSNTHFDFNMLISFSTLGPWTELTWIWPDFYNYVRLKSGTDPATVEAKFPAFAEKYLSEIMEENGFEARFGLQPVSQIHLESDYINEVGINANKKTLNFLNIIGIIVILIALMNFINLSTAKSIERAMEVGLKKVAGIKKTSLIFQFLFESLAINFLSILIAIGFVSMLIHPFNELVGVQVLSLEMWKDASVWLHLLILMLVGGLLAGAYPAFVLSSFKPAEVLKGRFHQSGKGALTRKGLVIAQFAISISLMAGTFIIYNQQSYMQDQELGYDADNHFIVNAPMVIDSTINQKIEVFKEELLRNPKIKSVTATNEIPGKKISLDNLVRQSHKKKEEGVNCDFLKIDHDFQPTYNVALLAGRNFREEDHTYYERGGPEFRGQDHRVMINNTAALALGFLTPEDAINQSITFPMQSDGTDGTAVIIGVLEDYHQESLQTDYYPIIYQNYTFYDAVYLTVNMNTANAQTTILDIGNKYEQFFPQDPYNYFFLNDHFNRQYEADLKFGNFFMLFAGLAIFIAVLGLFGLGSYLALKKTKELCVRKVLGANLMQVLLLIPKNLLGLVLISGIISIPITYLLANQWLSDYAFKIVLNPWLFMAPVLIVLVIAALSVLPESIKVALLNPSKYLRNE